MGLPSNRRRVHMPLPPKCHTVTRARFTLLVACQRPLIEPLNLQGHWFHSVLYANERYFWTLGL
jgi:hypothetical protein